jgi:hypothetical protein
MDYLRYRLWKALPDMARWTFRGPTLVFQGSSSLASVESRAEPVVIGASPFKCWIARAWGT